MASKANIRGRSAARPAFVARVLVFDRPATIQGQRGAVMLEAIAKPLKTCPGASLRILARWSGVLAPGTLVEVDGRRLEVLKCRPMTARQRTAHFLCRPCEVEPKTAGGADAAAP
jgi:hypothetical protein